MSATDAKRRLGGLITQNTIEPRVLLEPTAVHDASILEHALAADPEDVDGAWVLAMFYLLRSQVLAPQEAQQSAVAGVRWMMHVFVRDPDSVPEDMLSDLALHAPPAGNEPPEWYVEALVLMRSEASENDQVLNRAVSFSRLRRFMRLSATCEHVPCRGSASP